MSLTTRIEKYNGRPVLTINGEPTTEFWCYGEPNAIEDFAACGMRICQFHVPFPSWWTGPASYNFEPTDRMIAEFIEKLPSVLLMPRVNFGYVGEEWWGRLHPEELAVGKDLDGRPVDYAQIRARPVDCWFSSCSQEWTRDATEAMRAFIAHCEERFGECIVGYQIGGGISAEWFRWWNFVEEVYEDYSKPAEREFRRFLRERYGTDAALRAAWVTRADAESRAPGAAATGRPPSNVTLETAEVPAPRRLHEPTLGYFRDPACERDVVDWLECLSHGNASQIIALAEAAKRACGDKKIVGSFYGYVWPHWNTQSAARAGHMDMQRILACPAIDFISSPYHYDNRHLGGFHHSQTLPQTIEHAGKLHLDEIDTFTHLVLPDKTTSTPYLVPRIGADSCSLLRRDAASVLGTAGIGWWMDLHLDRWYNDPAIQEEVNRLQSLCRQALEWPCDSQAQVALVNDNRSYAWCSLHSPLNQYFTSMPRQLEWSDLGFPIDTITPWEIASRGPYRLYVFLNCWYLDARLRREITERVRRPGVTALWFHGGGFVSQESADERNVAEMAGMAVQWRREPTIPEIQLRGTDHPLLAASNDEPRGADLFGGPLDEASRFLFIAEPGHDWSAIQTPRFVVKDARAAVLGDYVVDGEPGLALIERDGWRSVFCGAPMLPGWLLRRLAGLTGVHLYTQAGVQIFQRGPLLSVYSPKPKTVRITLPDAQRARPLVFEGRDRAWRPDSSAQPAQAWSATFAAGETRFYLASS